MDSAPTGAPAVPSPEARGVIAQFLQLLGSSVRHFQALATLAGVEGREAAGLFVRLAIVVGGALICVGFGYIFLVLFVAFGVATLFGVSWVWITLALTIFHFLVAFLCAAYVRRHSRTPVFTETAGQFRKGIEAMQRLR